MSQELKDALQTMHQIKKSPNAAPVIYLHDPVTLKAFAAMVDLDLLSKIPESEWDVMDHDHREGTEDEW